ncbi:Regulator of chromosome condensation [Quaeritorhiza haematococci]|nr:Regulator of chromosome condensation [Quaeritorhiza haematococci]
MPKVRTRVTSSSSAANGTSTRTRRAAVKNATADEPRQPARRSVKGSSKKEQTSAEAPRSSTAKHVSPFPLKVPYTTVGEVFVVGSGDCGQLGLGPDVLEKERPGKLSYFEDKKIVTVVAGGMHNMALSADGKLYSWGCNDQLALGRDGEETEPAPVSGLDDQTIVQVVCGDSVTMALTDQGRAYAWGTFRNNGGILGYRRGVEAQGRPMLIEELKNVVSIAAGSNHLVAVTSDGKVYTWGVGDQNQLGRKILGRHTFESSLVPRAINFRPHHLKNNKFVHAYCGSYHTFLVHETSTIFAFGLNNHGQLGVGDTEQYDWPEKVEVVNPEAGVSEIAGGEHHSMVLNGKGDVYVFGRGDSNELGFGDKKSLETPTLQPAVSDVRSISCGTAFSLAITNEAGNNLYMWGYGEMGQLANGGEDAEVPFRVELKGREVITASAGGQHTVLLLKPKS